MNKPQRLSVGDIVALVNTVGMPPERFRKFIPLMERYLIEEGFGVKNYLADENSSDKDLAQNFTEAWLDPDVKAVFPICGSDRIFQVIQRIDPQELATKQVIFCGSSALSSISLWLNLHSGLVTFFGPHLPFIHSYAPQRENEFSVQSFWSMIMWRKGRTKRISSVHEKHHFFSVKDQVASTTKITNIYFNNNLIIDERRRDAKFYTSHCSPIKGMTCCITLSALLTLSRNDRYLSLGRSIVFTETMDWTLQQVRDTFRELAKTKALKDARAVFLTTLTERTDRNEYLYPELRNMEKIRELCESISDMLSLPVLYGFPLGHGAYKLTLPQGINCVVDPTDGSVTLLEQPVI